MKRRAIVCMKVMSAVLLALLLSTVTTTHYTAHAQGSIGQPA